MSEETNADINELDTSWIDEFESLDEDYKSFYLEDIITIKIQYIYVNKENGIDMIKEESILLHKPNIISREELIGILKRNNIQSEKKYATVSILTYNMDIEPSDISAYIKDPSSFLTSVQHIDDIILHQSISMFHDLNNLIILFYEKSNQSKTVNMHNLTKRIFLNSIHGKRKKTIRKTA
uniref:Uncharacterized protein n=1 Tax=viral metagenome TaxID=1070528 RepID=A0A6C0AZY0_9ZZZZ